LLLKKYHQRDRASRCCGRLLSRSVYFV